MYIKVNWHIAETPISI